MSARSRTRAPARPRPEAPAGDAPPGSATPVWGTGRLAVLGALLVVAIALRLWHVRHGLPDFVEEAIPFRRALAMWGWESGHADWNPHLFHYPSLSFYLSHLLQRAHVAWGLAAGQFQSANDYYVLYQLDATPMVVVARLLGVAADAATLIGVAVIGERLGRGVGLVAAALAALAPVMILTSRAIYADTPMTALAVWSLERMLAYRARGGTARLSTALVLAGLAAGTKYPALLLLVPLAWVLVERHRARAVMIGPVAVAAVLAVALLTSPFILIDVPTFRRDAAFLRELPMAGHLGNLELRAFPFYLGLLVRNVGWVGAILMVLSLVRMLVSRPGRGEATVLWLVLLAFALPISLSRINVERYLVPVIPVAALLIGMAARFVADRARPGWARPLGFGLAAALLVPVLVGGIRAGASGAEDSQLEARRWCEERLSADDLLVQEAYGVRLPTRAALELDRDQRPVRLASAAVRERFLARKGFRVVTLPLSVAGSCASRVGTAGGPPVEVEIFAHAADFNRLFYDPRLLIGVDYVLTSSAVRGRFAADPRRFAAEDRVYRLLDESAQVVARFPSRPGIVGPSITIYRLGARMDSVIAARHGRLDRYWWAAPIPSAYRERAEGMLRSPGEPHVMDVMDAGGHPAAWVRSLAEVFEEKIHPFGSQMVDELTDLHEWDQGARFAAANLEMAPADLEDCLAFTACSGRLGDWDRGRAAVERAIAATPPDDPGLAYLRLERARILAHMGR